MTAVLIFIVFVTADLLRTRLEASNERRRREQLHKHEMEKARLIEGTSQILLTDATMARDLRDKLSRGLK